MSESLRIMTGLCQTHDRSQFNYLHDLAKLRVTQLGKLVPAIHGIRFCTIKSRTNLHPTREGMGIDYKTWEQNHQQIRSAINGKELMKPIRKTVAREWVEQIAVTGMHIGFECIDEVHAMMFSGIIPAYMGLCWTPSVSNLGETAQQIAETVAENRWAMGIKNPKFPPVYDPEHPENPSDLEKTWTGIVSYALGVGGIANMSEIILIQRGVVDRDPKLPGENPWRNFPIHKSTIMAKQMVEQMLATIPEEKRPKLIFAYDPSHSNGEKRRDQIVQDSIHVASLRNQDVLDHYNRLNPEGHVYDMLLIESNDPKAAKPLSDAGQHITGEEVQNIVDAVAKIRPIQAR